MLETPPAHGSARVMGFVALSAALGGCSANQYATPRTVPAGEVLHTIAAETVGDPGDEFLPNIRYRARIGLAERVDLGVTAGPMFGADVKVNFVRTKRVDLALAPGFELQPALMLVSREYSENTPYIQGKLPLLLGVNVMREVSIYMHGGLASTAYVEYGTWCSPSTCIDQVTYASMMGGIGVQIRLSDFVSLQPETSIIASFKEKRVQPNLFQFGFGVSLGAQPDYKDLD